MAKRHQNKSPSSKAVLAHMEKMDPVIKPTKVGDLIDATFTPPPRVGDVIPSGPGPGEFHMKVKSVATPECSSSDIVLEVIP